MTRIRLLGACLLLAIDFASNHPLFAVSVVEVRICHGDSKICQADNGLSPRRITYIEDGVNKTPGGWPIDSSPTIQAPQNSKVLVTIVDPNPLLFRYALQKGAAERTSNDKALASFTDSLASFLGIFEPKAPTGRALQLIEDSAIVQVKCAAEIKELIQVGQDVETSSKQRVAIASQSLSDHSGAKEAVNRWDLDSLSKRLKAADDKLDKKAGELLALPDDTPNVTVCRSSVALARTGIPKMSKLLEDLNAFATQAGQIDKPIVLEAFNVNIAENQPIEVKISKAEGFPASLKTDLFIGDTRLTVAPSSRVVITVGAAAIYSFVRAPSFSAPSMGGKFVIKQATNDYQKVDVAAMMEIEPTAWDLGPLGVGIQLGVSPKTDVGLFLGVSLRATGYFTLGAGVAFQRVDTLATGLSLGQTIDSPDLLKTSKTFRSGLYLHVTVTTKKKS